MDKIDRKILRELQADGRRSNQELSSRVALSPSPCLRRVRALEAANVIEGYCAVVDQERYGLPINVFVSVSLEKPTDESIRTFEAGIKDLDEVMECYLMTGPRDYLLRVVSESLKAYERFIREDLTKIPGITSIESSFVFSQVKRKQVYPEVRGMSWQREG